MRFNLLLYNVEISTTGDVFILAGKQISKNAFVLKQDRILIRIANPWSLTTQKLHAGSSSVPRRKLGSRRRGIVNADMDSAGAVRQSQFEHTGLEHSSRHFVKVKECCCFLASACGLCETDPRRNWLRLSACDDTELGAERAARVDFANFIP